MSAQSPKQPMQSKQSDQASASQTKADRVPAKRKATEQPQDDRPPTRPGTLPFMWNLPTTPSLPNLNAGSTPVASDDEYEYQLELENVELREQLKETEEQLREAEEKIAALEERLKTDQANVVVPTTNENTSTEPVDGPGNGQSEAESEAEALKARNEEEGEEKDTTKRYLGTFKEIEWAADEHHKLVHQALDEIDSGRVGPRGRDGEYKPGQLPLYILDKYHMDLYDSVSHLKELFYGKQEEE